MEKSSERVAEAKAAVSSISPQEAKRRQDSDSKTVFVDPRPAEGIASTTGIIPGALNIQLNDIAGGKLPAELSDKSTPVITSCQGGPMGAIAAHELTKQGLSNVVYIDGGTQGWLNAGFTTTK
jgi:rhodanese-related sulfurtransferase